jgi:hypothetical protein
MVPGIDRGNAKRWRDNMLALWRLLLEMASSGGTGTCATGYYANGVCNIK